VKDVGSGIIIIKPEGLNSLRAQNASLKRGEHIKYMSYAFTEQGEAMLSGIMHPS
jgi:hypothetical protein